MTNKDTREKASGLFPGNCRSLLHYAEKEIYENITQCPCLAKMQIAGVEWKSRKEAMARIGEANLLLGKAVQDLRKLARELAILKDKKIQE